MIRAFLFDMDGTLVDSEILWVEAVEAYMNAKGRPITHEEGLELVYGISWEDIYLGIQQRFPELSGGMDAMYAGLRPFFQDLCDSRDVRIHSSIDLLRRLAAHYPVCIVSGSFAKDIEDAIALMDVAREVTFYLGGEHYAPGKPDPACYLMAAEKLGLHPSECLAFEDSSAGIHAAKMAGMHCVALARRGRPKQDVSEADFVLDDLAKFSADALPGFLQRA